MGVRRAVTLVAVAIGLVLAGCAGAGKPSAALEGTAWALETIHGQSALANTSVTLVFERERLSGSDGCNQYSGPYTVAGERFALGKEVVTTLMACDDPIMAQANAYLGALRQAVEFETDGQRLTLLDADGTALATFVRQTDATSGG